MLMLAVVLLVGFALGYGVRKWVSGRRNAAARKLFHEKYEKYHLYFTVEEWSYHGSLGVMVRSYEFDLARTAFERAVEKHPTMWVRLCDRGFVIEERRPASTARSRPEAGADRGGKRWQTP